MVLLDTDVLSRLRDGRSPRLRSWLASLPEPPAISVFTLLEIQFGIARVRTTDADFSARLARWLDQVIATTDIRPLTTEAACLAGGMRAAPNLETLEGDLVIAATAVTEEMQVATLNQRHFRQIAAHFPALVIIDPLAA